MVGVIVLFWAGFGKTCGIAYEDNSYEIEPDDDSLPAQSVEPSQQSSTSTRSSACPEGMQHIVGEFCEQRELVCLKYIDTKGSCLKYNHKTKKCEKKREPIICAEWKKPTKCKGKTVHKDFCMDTYEYPNKKGELPMTNLSFNKAQEIAKKEGKRLCTNSEWTFAAEGEEGRPYPFGDGYHRDSSLCNIDNEWRDYSKLTFAELDQRVPSGSFPQCRSSFGVYDMSGNVDEAIVNESGKPFKSGFMGGHWAKGARNASRPITKVHNESFSFYEIGTRLCKDSQ